MKLYYSAGACSLSPHIALEESGLPYEAISAPTKTKLLPDGSDYRKVNPLGYVPYLINDQGEGLAEGPAIVQYIADQAPGNWDAVIAAHLTAAFLGARAQIPSMLARGKGAAKIRWGVPGDFNRCRLQLAKYVQNPDWLAGPIPRPACAASR